MAIEGATKERASSKIKEPKQYNVIMLNDDFTTMEFVVAVLEEIFHKDAVSAQAIMLQVHNHGKAVVGKYPLDIAKTKVNKAITRARKEGFPFRMVVEEA